MIQEAAAAPAPTHRFTRKRAEILAAASDVLNREGVKGTTLAEVAAQVGLNTTSITYYFRRKEDLATACFLDGIARQYALIQEATAYATPPERLAALLEATMQRHARRKNHEVPPMVSLNDMRMLEAPHYDVVSDAYKAMVRAARGVLELDPAQVDSERLHARTVILIEQVFWSGGWLLRRDVNDFPYVGSQMRDILENGIAARPDFDLRNAPRTPATIHPEPCNRDRARETFLIASTRLINRLGYRGASVEKISAELNVTKGSFYHYNEGKDELVLACFERTIDVIARAQRAAMEGQDDGLSKLARSLATLIDFQCSERGPLARTLGLVGLPPDLKTRMLELQAQVSDRFCAMIAEGIGDGSIRPVDPVVAAQLIKTGLQSTSALAPRLKAAGVADPAEALLRPLLLGVLAG